MSPGDGKEQHLEFLERVFWAKGMAYAKILWCQMGIRSSEQVRTQPGPDLPS